MHDVLAWLWPRFFQARARLWLISLGGVNNNIKITTWLAPRSGRNFLFSVRIWLLIWGRFWVISRNRELPGVCFMISCRWARILYATILLRWCLYISTGGNVWPEWLCQFSWDFVFIFGAYMISIGASRKPQGLENGCSQILNIKPGWVKELLSSLSFSSPPHYHLSSGASYGWTHLMLLYVASKTTDTRNWSFNWKFEGDFSAWKCWLVDFLTAYAQVQLTNDTISPRLAATKVLIQSILSSLSPHRSYKKKTASLAQQAVHVAVKISALIETTNELPQLVRHCLTQFEE